MALTKALVLASNYIVKRPIPNSNYFNAGGLTPPAFSNALESYLNVGWLHAVVFRIALGCSEVEWTLFDTANQDKPKQIFKHPILNLLHQVNPFQTSNEFIALDTIYNELIGESYWALNFNALGEPAEIILPYPHRMSVVPAKEFPFVKGYVYGTGAEAVPFDVNEIIHFKYPNPLNQYHGLAPARAIGINLDAEQNADKWVNQFFYNSARPDGVIQFDYNLSDEQFEKLKKQWSEKYKGVSKAHQVALLEGGGKYLQIQNSIKDMDFPNLKQKNRDVILGVFGMPQSVMGISENVNKANAEAGDYTFARWIVKPRLDWKKAKLQEQLIPKFRRSENLELGFMEVVPETIEQKRDLAESGMRAGYLTINEARKMQRLVPLPNGDVLLVPLNLIATDITKPMNTPVSPPIETPPVSETPKGKGGEGSGNFGHEGRPGEVGGSGEGGGGEKPSGDKPLGGGDSGGGGKPYASESRSSLKLSSSERQQLAKDNLYLHGTSSEFDEFKNDTGHGVIYVSDPSNGRITQVEHIADGPLGGRLVAVKVSDSKLTRFDPRNDTKAAELYKTTLGKDAIHDYIDYPDMGKLAPVAIGAGYSDFRVYEPAVMGFSRAVSKPTALKIVKEWKKKP